MATKLKHLKNKHKRILSITDKGNVIKIQQPDMMDVALLYAAILEKINKPIFY